MKFSGRRQQSKADISIPRAVLLAFLGVVAVSLMLNGAATTVIGFLSAGRTACHKDLIQEYVMARAALDGGDMYDRIDLLADRYLPYCHGQNDLLIHPSPHPPPLLLLGISLQLLSFRHAAVAWLAVEVALCFFTVRFLVSRAAPGAPRYILPLIFLAVLGLRSMRQELLFGQVNTLLLALTAAGYYRTLARRDVSAGIAFGLGFAFKMFGGPILIYLAWRRRFKTVVAAAATFVIVHAATLWFVGIATYHKYFFEVAPSVSKRYSMWWANISLWTLSRRLFEGFDNSSHLFGRLQQGAYPLIDFPALEPIVRLPLVAMITIGALWLAVRCRRIEAGMGLALCLSLVCNPIAWEHAVLITMIIVPFLVESLRKEGLRACDKIALLLIADAHFGPWARFDQFILFKDPAIVNSCSTFAVLAGLAGLAVLLVSSDAKWAAAGRLRRFTEDGPPLFGDRRAAAIRIRDHAPGRRRDRKFAN